jgi:DNA-binding beta-propeller fold protein YncE
MKQRRIHFGFAGILALVLMSELLAISSAVPAKAAPFAYVVNWCPSSFCLPANVTVIDVANGTTVATVPLSGAPNGASNPVAVTVAPDGMHAYVACDCASFPPSNGNPTGTNSPLLWVIDTAANTVVAQVFQSVAFADQGTFALAVTPDGSRVYAVGSTGSATGAFNRAVFVVDTATNTVLTTIVDTRLNNPYQVAITPDGTRAYVTDFTGVVHVIDTNPASPTYNTILTELPTNSLAPRSVAITPDGSRAYVPAVISSNPFGGNPILVIDTNPASPTYNTVLTTLAAPSGNPLAFVAITPDGSRAYVTQCNPNFACTTGGAVQVIDTNPSSSTYNTLLTTINVPQGSGSYGVAITPDGTRGYVTSCAPGVGVVCTVSLVSVVDTNPTSPTYNTVIASVTAGVSPIAVAIANPVNRNICPESQGFWKGHAGLWPVTSLLLGGRNYTETQLISILNTSSSGNAALILTDQLIAAKLNLDVGSNPAPISNAVTTADSELAAVPALPTVVRTNTAAGQAMTATAATLDSYNNDQLTPNCTPFIGP